LTKDHGRDTLVLSDPESVALFAGKFIVKSLLVVNYLQHLEVLEFKGKMRAEDKAKESREAKLNHKRIILGLSCVKM